MIPLLGQNLLLALGLSAIPLLSVGAAFPALLLTGGRRRRPMSETILRLLALAGVVAIFVFVYPLALAHKAPARGPNHAAAIRVSAQARA